MQEKVYVDTSSLIILSKINAIHLLKKIYGKIYITSFIESEFNEPIPPWIIVVPQNKTELYFLKEFNLGLGESSIIMNALNNKAFLIIDDLKARKTAAILKLNFTGSIGILIIAKELGLINSISFYLKQIQKSNFRISDVVINKALEIANEK